MADHGKMMLLPPRADRCQVCGSQHEPEMPHNAQSLYYQVAFQMEHNRGATWIDAMEHCSPEMRAAWIAALAERGVDVAAGEVNPPRKDRQPHA